MANNQNLLTNIETLEPYGRDYCINVLQQYENGEVPHRGNLASLDLLDEDMQNWLSYFDEEAEVVASLVLTQLHSRFPDVTSEELEAIKFGETVKWFAVTSGRLELEGIDGITRMADLELSHDFPRAADALIDLLIPPISSRRHRIAEENQRLELPTPVVASAGQLALIAA